MTCSISTRALAAHLEDPTFILVDSRDMAAFNGWPCPGMARGGHIRGAVAFPLAWTASLPRVACLPILATKGITPAQTIVVYDAERQRSNAMAQRLGQLGYPRILTYDAGVRAWAADTSLPMARLARYDRLVSPAWVWQLSQSMSADASRRQDMVLCEVGWAGAAAYQTGHIPGAQYLALEDYEQAPLWTCIDDARLEERLVAQGIRYDTTVVLYGRDTTAAARTAVLLLYAGVEDVRLVDGGLAAWRAAGYPVETTVHRPHPVGSFGASLPAHPEYLMTTTDVKAFVAAPQTALVSIRSWAEYIGATSGYPYIRHRGRIAGDVWGHAGAAPRRMDHYRNVDNTARPCPEIAACWQTWGITPDKHVAFYCGTGWRASEAFFYAYVMGWPRLAVYDGGWWAWVQDPANPIVCGAPCYATAPCLSHGKTPWPRTMAPLYKDVSEYQPGSVLQWPGGDVDCRQSDNVSTICETA